MSDTILHQPTPDEPREASTGDNHQATNAAREIGPVVHVAGLVINLGGHLRQRCAWCGALLDDVELVLTAGLIEHADQPYPTWPEGGLVAVDGGMRWTVQSDPLPEGLCARLDPAVTA